MTAATSAAAAAATVVNRCRTPNPTLISRALLIDIPVSKWAVQEGGVPDRHQILRGDNVLLLEQQSVEAPVMSGLQTEQMSVRVVQ